MDSKPGIFQTLRIIFVLIYMVILLTLLSIVSVLLFVLSFGKLRNFLVRWIGFVFGRTILALAGVRLKFIYHGEKPDKPAIFLFNHSSTLDLFIVVSLMLPPTRYIAKKELQYNPFFWLLNKILGNIMIDRNRSRATMDKLHVAYKHLREKRISLVFAPEGTRSLTGEIGPFKSGAFHTALDLGYPIVPIYIEGAFELCPGNSLITNPGEVTIHYYPPVDTNDWDSKKLRAHIADIRNRYLEWSGQQN